MAPADAVRSEPSGESRDDTAIRRDPAWPGANGQRTVFLLDASSGFESALLTEWIHRQRPEGTDDSDFAVLSIPPSRRRSRGVSLAPLEEELAAGDDALLAPVRAAWLPRKRDGVRAVRLSDLLRLGDPRDPGPLRQRFIRWRDPSRCRIVAGEPAPASELRQRWRSAGGQDAEETTGLAEFVARQAALALERAERRLRGARYKVPRLVDEDILNRPAFRGGLARLGRRIGKDAGALRNEARRYLKEIAATHSPFVIDIAAHLIWLLYTRGYDAALHYDPRELERVKALSQLHPVVFLPSHKSNLDHLVLQYALHETGHPPNHTAGGINMNFFPVGPIVRRSGVFFIRRSFKDNPVYKFVLQHYIDYLIEKRFSLEWYIEGGRSRTGKLLPPRFGLLAYVVDAYRRGKSEDVHLIPVSIAYDQIQDVSEYAAEQRGAAKPKESFGWFLGVIRRLRRRYGVIHFRFGEPLSLAKALGHPDPEAEPDPDETNLAVQKLAFEVCYRINEVTPITESSLVTLAMLGSGFRALSLDEVVQALENVVRFVNHRGLPRVSEFHLEDREGVRRALEALVANDVVTRYDDGLEPVYVIGPDQQLAAAYYRNTIVHFFLIPCIAELALLGAAEEGVAEPLAEFWEDALRLRDLFKFEFFFAEKESFRGALIREMRFHDPDWEARAALGQDSTRELVQRFRPFSSHRVLRPFADAYRIVGDLLEAEGDGAIDPARFVDRCMRLGRQYHLQRRLHSAASVSKMHFQTALQLAENRGLLDPATPDLAAARAALAAEIRSVVRRIEAVDALAATRRAGWLS